MVNNLYFTRLDKRHRITAGRDGAGLVVVQYQSPLGTAAPVAVPYTSHPQHLLASGRAPGSLSHPAGKHSFPSWQEHVP